MNFISITELRGKISEIVGQAQHGNKQTVVTNHGKPVAVIVSFDEFMNLVPKREYVSDEDAMQMIREWLRSLPKAEHKD